MAKCLLKVGDLVKIKQGTFDWRMGDGCAGVILERISVKTGIENGMRKGTAVFDILFTNGETRKFHGKFLDQVSAA